VQERVFKKIFTTPMKSASLLIDMNFIGQAEPQHKLHKLQKASILGCKVPRRALYYPKGRVVLLFGVSAKSKKSKNSVSSVSPAKRAVKKRCSQSRVMLVRDSFLRQTAMGAVGNFAAVGQTPRKSLTIYIITNR